MSQLKDTLKYVVGRGAEILMPVLGREIDANRNTDRAPRLKRAIVQARLQRAKSQGDEGRIETALAAFWKGKTGDRFHENHNAHRFDLFEAEHAGVISELARQIGASGLSFPRMVEIGCGDGQVLEYCADHLPMVERFIGLDINAAVIERTARAMQADTRLAFVEAEACEWLTANPEPGTILLSNGGVLEYLTQANVDRLLQALVAHRPATVVLVEPVAPDHDLATQPDSFVFGYENSFSHNHRERLIAAGLTVVHARELPLGGVRWMLMIGLAE
ncbi:methyltransferase domain-containing protein [Arenibacterium sp. CAU 1754]